MPKFKTTAAYISGAICGDMWAPMTLAGTFYKKDLRGPFGVYKKGDSFEDVVRHCILSDGGNFRNPQFTCDSIIRIERVNVQAAGKYMVHVKEIDLAKITPDWVNKDVCTADVCEEE